MTLTFSVVIPARLEATRLPAKLVQTIGEKSLLHHVYDSARRSSAQQVIIATDSDQIREHGEAFGATVIMTSPLHTSGTDRIAEAVEILDIPDDMIIINTQGDEYGLPAAVIDQLAGEMLAHPDRPMATLCEAIENDTDLNNPNIVKVVRDASGAAMYFSRLPVPWQGAGKSTHVSTRHIGIYGYRAGFLRIYTQLSPCALEQSEKLEQLRAMYYGHRIHVAEACMPCGMEVNTPEDLEKARKHEAGRVPA